MEIGIAISIFCKDRDRDRDFGDRAYALMDCVQAVAESWTAKIHQYLENIQVKNLPYAKNGLM